VCCGFVFSGLSRSIFSVSSAIDSVSSVDVLLSRLLVWFPRFLFPLGGFCGTFIYLAETGGPFGVRCNRHLPEDCDFHLFIGCTNTHFNRD